MSATATFEAKFNGTCYMYTVTSPAGRVLITTDVQSLALRVQREANTIPTPAAQVVSPLPAAERCSSGLAAGATLTMPTEPQARALAGADTFGHIPRYGYRGVGYTVLRALKRRGWVELNHPVRFDLGRITEAGRKALARYEARHGAL